jgi:hypothetical protein
VRTYELVQLAGETFERFPNAELVKNAVGNLAVVVDETYVGYLDLVDGTLHVFEELFEEES